MSRLFFLTKRTLDMILNSTSIAKYVVATFAVDGESGTNFEKTTSSNGPMYMNDFQRRSHVITVTVAQEKVAGQLILLQSLHQNKSCH